MASRHTVKRNDDISDPGILDAEGFAHSAGRDPAIVDIELRAYSLRAVEARRDHIDRRDPRGSTRKARSDGCRGTSLPPSELSYKG